MTGLLELMILTTKNSSSVYNGFTGSSLLKNTSAELAWNSFGQIGLALITIGFCIRCIALMRLAVMGRRNVVEVTINLIASTCAIMILQLWVK